MYEPREKKKIDYCNCVITNILFNNNLDQFSSPMENQIVIVDMQCNKTSFDRTVVVGGG